MGYDSGVVILPSVAMGDSGPRGATHVLTDALESATDGSVRVLSSAWEQAPRLARRHASEAPVIFTQQEGDLSPEYGRWARRCLEAGAHLVELNVFNKPSLHRPIHPQYTMALYTADGADRFALRCRSAGVPLPSGYLPLPNVLSPTRARVPGRRISRHALRVLRVGRPDATKWSRWEIDYCNLLAARAPDWDVDLTLVGFPWPSDCIGPTQPNLHVKVTGEARQVESLYSANDVYLHYSRIGETYGNTIAEAWNAGLTVVNACDIAWDTAPLEYLPDDQVIVGTLAWLNRHVDKVGRRIWEACHEGNGEAERATVGLSTSEYLSRLLHPLDMQAPMPGATSAAMSLAKRARRAKGVETGLRALAAEVYRGAKNRRHPRSHARER